jgi:hypothetical protein
LLVLTLAACRFPPPTPIIIHLEATVRPILPTVTYRPPIAAATHSGGPTATALPFRPEATPIAALRHDEVLEIPIIIGAIPQKLALGPTSAAGAYLVEIVPGLNAPDGAHIVTSILPESDGEQWRDVLTYASPEIGSPIEATARIRLVSGWRVAGRFALDLKAGEWVGIVISDQALGVGYLVEVNPLEPMPAGNRIETARILPEFNQGQWRDVLRIQSPRGQTATAVEVVVYAAPATLSYDSYDLSIKAGDWPGWGIDSTTSPQAYLVGVKPLTQIESHIETVVVQQEFNGSQWHTLVRAALGANRPELSLRIIIYQIP